MENIPAGWLVLHTEGCEPKTYALKEGKNRIGRKTVSNAPDIPVENDIYVSRNHAMLVVKRLENLDYEYIIADNTELLGKPSLNGTFINGSPERIDEKPVKLKDGDTIQCGVTKFVLQSTKAAIDVENAVKLTSKLDFTPTVQINNSAAILRKRVN